MASKKPSSDLVDPRDMFKTRGQYGGVLPGGLVFTGVRSTLPLIYYSLLAPTTSPYSFFARFPSVSPAAATPLPPANLSIPGLPGNLLNSLSHTLGLSSYSTVIFLGVTLSTVEFTFYNLLWRRERLPISGSGGALMISAIVNTVDLVHALLYVYTASRNPTWTPTLFRWMPLVFALGLGLHGWSDHTKWLYRSDKRNDGKIKTDGVWGLVRHPNFLGFTIWRVAFACATGGWAFGLFLAVSFGIQWSTAAIPALEVYMERRYGQDYEKVKEKVPYKMIPGIW